MPHAYGGADIDPQMVQVERLLQQLRKLNPELSKLEFMLEQAGTEYATELKLVREAKAKIGLAGDKIADRNPLNRI